MSVSYVPGVPFTSYITGSLVKFDPKVNDLCVIAKFTSKSRVTQRILHGSCCSENSLPSLHCIYVSEQLISPIFL